MKRHQDERGDSHTCKQQKTAKEEEAPNSLLSLPKEILQYCISFVGQGHYQFVGSVCKRINKIYAYNNNDSMKETFWSNVAVTKDLAELCLDDHQELGHTQDEIWELVHRIGKLSAKSENEEVFKWAIRNDFYFIELFEGNDLFLDITKKGQLRVLEIASSIRLQWYSRQMLEDAAARFNVELLYFIFNQKPNEFNLSFTTMCISKGYFYALNWWKETELLELFCNAAYNGQCKILEVLKNDGWQQRPPHLERNAVNSAAHGGHINALEWAQDQGWYGDNTESCAIAALNGHLHVLQWL
jgi:hypothetical protein